MGRGIWTACALACAAALLLACGDEVAPALGGELPGTASLLPDTGGPEPDAATPAPDLTQADADGGPLAPTGPPALLETSELRALLLPYLEASTESLDAKSSVDVMAHLVRAAIDPAWEAPSEPIPEDSWDHVFDKLYDLRDTSDFDAIELVNLLYRFDGHPLVPDALWDKTAEALVAFKFWYTQPTREGVTDDMWYWSENHEALFHTIEYLTGARYPDKVFAQTGMTGAEHMAHGKKMLRDWLEVRGRFGFTEFHSNVYWPHTFRPMISLAELAPDEEIATRAAMIVDVMLFDLALHTHRGVYGVAHGRTYMKDKTNAFEENTYTTAATLFGTAQHDVTGGSDPNLVLLAHSSRYRLPRVILDVAKSPGPFVDKEQMGLPLDEHEEVGEGNPVGPYGFEYTEDELALWWSMGALSVWQVLPITLDVVERYDLWDTDLFQGFDALKPLLALDTLALQEAARELAHMAAMGLLTKVESYTYRTPDYMLASAQDYRKGSRANQIHTWQATLDSHALVFTTHPGHGPRESLEWGDDGQPGSWTGTASIPRTAQHENVAIHIYCPQYTPVAPPLDAFSSYEPYTHAFFPQERFDEVVRSGHWTFGRKGEGYIGLWSWREPEWVVYDPAIHATDGMTEPFDLRAPGGAHNVWIVEMGRAADNGDFAAFQKDLESAAIEVEQVTKDVPTGVVGPLFEVSYASPSVGAMTFNWTDPPTLEGAKLDISGYPRFDNPWSQAPFDGGLVVIADPETGIGVSLDFDNAVRSTVP